MEPQGNALRVAAASVRLHCQHFPVTTAGDNHKLRLPILIVLPSSDEYCILQSFAVLEETPRSSRSRHPRP